MHGVFTKFLDAVPIKEKIDTMRAGSSPEEVGAKLKKLIDAARVHVHNIFTQFDKDGSGCIDKDELAGVAEQLGLKMTKIDLHNMVMDLDKDRDGAI